MSTKDQILSAELHGEALLTAKRPEPQPLIDHLRERLHGAVMTSVPNAPESSRARGSQQGTGGEELIAAGLRMLAGPSDLHELDKWVRVGEERRRAAPSTRIAFVF
jgi:hypothetical protein